jgi:phosphoribosylaminoimidazole (AIR) synthetase
MSRALRDALSSLDIGVCIAEEDVGGRIVGFSPESPAFNLSGSVVSTIDEDYLKNPLVPSAGEYLVAIAGVPNPRSNGITSKRKLMVDMLGADWHDSRMGRAFLGYLATPSTLFYPVFRELADQHLATSFYHMSGGAYNGKLARPLAKHGLFAEIDSTQLFQPDWRESAIQHLSGTSNENAYQQWPMGNDGFITTSEPEKAISVIERRGLKARVVAKLEVIRGGKTGVLLKGITGSDDADVYYSGKAA